MGGFVESMSEVGKSLLPVVTLECSNIRMRRRTHGVEYASDRGHHRIRATISEGRGKQTGDLLIQWMFVTQNQLQRIGSNGGHIEGIDQFVQTASQQARLDWLTPHVLSLR